MTASASALLQLAAANPGETAVLAARLLLAVIALPLLYRALAEPDPGPRDGMRRLGFAALGAVVLFTFTERWHAGESNPEQGRGFQAFTTGVNLYRMELAGLDFGREGTRSTRERALEELTRAAKAVPESAYFQRYLGIALAESGRRAEALRALDRAATALEGRAPERARAERVTWRRLFGPTAPAEADLRTAGSAIHEWRLGWIGSVALAAAYRRTGNPAAALEESVRREAAEYYGRALPALACLLLLVPQLGLIALGVGTVLIRSGVLRRARVAHHPVAAVLWEGFILYLALSLVPRFIVFPGRRPSPETQPALVAWLLLASDLAQLGALVYLWWRLRGKGLSLAEIGLTPRALGAGVAVAAMAAVVIIPAALLLNLTTHLVTERVFPNLPPPYHPLSGLTATSGQPAIRWALFAAAVIGAPVLEEVFFRGTLYGALRRRFGVGAALLGSSAFFAILHPQLPLGFLPLAGLGAAFALLYEWRQSLVPGMVVHAINNGLVFLLLTLTFPLRG